MYGTGAGTFTVPSASFPQFSSPMAGGTGLFAPPAAPTAPAAPQFGGKMLGPLIGLAGSALGAFGQMGAANRQSAAIEKSSALQAKVMRESLELQEKMNEQQLAAQIEQQQRDFTNAMFAEEKKMLLAGSPLGSRIFRKGAFASMAEKGATPQQIGLAGRFLS
jgi:hypothetical protein